MAERRDADNEEHQDALIAQLVPDPAETPNMRAVFGFLGRSTRDRYVRLYVSPDLDEYVEVPEEAIVHREQLSREQSALGGTILWIDRTATLLHTRTVSRDAQEDFLQGSITAAFLRGAKAGAQLGADALAALRVGDTDPTVCRVCPHSDFAPVCTLASSCLTTVPTDPGCRRVLSF